MTKLGDKETVSRSPMAMAWREAAKDLGIRFESPFCLVHEAGEVWASGLLRDFGGTIGTIVAGRFCAEDILDVADALDFYTSGLSPHYYERYDRDLFVDTLNDWGWFGAPGSAPSWFCGGYGTHGGQSVFVEADAAFQKGDLAETRRVLVLQVERGNVKAEVALGTFLTMSGNPSFYDEGVAMLRALADAGNGHAAHNLATALATPAPGRHPDRDRVRHYMAIATDSGFEAGVASDPNWWRR